jgi:uncharacterized protein (TIGR00725 family)
MNRRIIVGVMGGGSATETVRREAYELGACIARRGWVLLCGGRDAGVMTASARGAAEHGGLTVGILPDDNRAGVSPYIHIPVVTGMGNARNAINVLSSDVVVACQGGTGTLSEIALALKSAKPVVLLDFDRAARLFEDHRDQLAMAATVKEAERAIERFLA